MKIECLNPFITGESFLSIKSDHADFAFALWSCRNLSKPIAVQSKEKEDRYVDNYRVGSASRVSQAHQMFK